MSVFEEFKKIKGFGVYPALTFLLLLPICVQGLLGLGPEVTDYRYYVTTFGLFCRLFLGVSIGLLVSLSFYSEYRRKGYLNIILNGQSFTRLLNSKVLFFYLFMLMYLLVAISVSLGVQLFDGSNISVYYKDLLFSFTFLFLSSILLINIHMLFCLIFSQQPMFSLMIAVICSLLNIFISPTTYSISFPWAYPINILYFTSLQLVDYIVILLATLISSCLLLYCNQLYGRKKQFI